MEESQAGLIDQTTEAVESQTSDMAEQSKMFSFAEAKIHLERLKSTWSEEIEKTKTRRSTRDVDIDTEDLRKAGKLDEDETLIPVRVIDTNITREQPPFINYLKNSRRLMTFRSLTNPEQDPQLIEQEFTRGMTYIGWENVHFKVKDGADTHGWAACEVVYDPSKPLNVGLEYIEHENLFWPRSVKDIQDSPRVIRVYNVTFSTLKKWVRNYGFSAEQVNNILSSTKNTQKEIETVVIYKLFMKVDGVVYVAWFSLEHAVNDWLKAPTKLFVGISEQVEIQVPDPLTGMPTPQKQWSDSDVDMYPIFVLPYRESEKPELIERKGRVFLDENKQEAQTAILSGFVNGLTRASNIYASPSQEDGTGEGLKELKDIKLNGGRIMSKPINFWSPDYPDPMVIRALQYLDTSNSQEVNQVNFAAQNREDSRKTATEISAAKEDQQLLNSVQLTLFSTHVRAVYSFAWLIVQSQAMQGKLVFLQIKQQQPLINPIDQQPVIDQNTGQPAMDEIWVNDMATIGQKWELRAAGDTDVIQRQQKIQQMKQDWPVIANTPLATRFLADLMKLQYPDVGDQYAQVLSQMDQMQQMLAIIAQLNTVVKGYMQKNEGDPEQQQNMGPLMQMTQQADQVVASMEQANTKQPRQ